jgi:hypothetical protein
LLSPLFRYLERSKKAKKTEAALQAGQALRKTGSKSLEG